MLALESTATPETIIAELDPYDLTHEQLPLAVNLAKYTLYAMVDTLLSSPVPKLIVPRNFPPRMMLFEESTASPCGKAPLLVLAVLTQLNWPAPVYLAKKVSIPNALIKPPPKSIFPWK